MSHVRLTEKPLRIGFNIVESAANTFTTQPLVLPTTPSIQISRGGGDTALGVEVMKVIVETERPDKEPGQNNTMEYEIVKGAAPGAMLEKENQRTIFRRLYREQTEDATGIEQGLSLELHDEGDLTDGDGNGELVADNEIHLSALGAGNAGAKRMRGYLLYHVVEISTTEALFELIETAG